MLLALLLATPAVAIDLADTRMLADPAISGSHIAFVYDHDIWISGRDGQNVRRLTSYQGIESDPTFSPDGQWVAFAGEYDGNTDVFVVSIGGGEPKRLTWHPDADIPVGFTPDGRVLFRSQRQVHTRRYWQLFAVPVGGGFPELQIVPHATSAAWRADDAVIAYNPLRPAFAQWKHYRGGTHSRLWIFDTKTYDVTIVSQPPERSNDVEPMWVDSALYFLSDRNGEFNIFRWNPADNSATQITFHDDFPVVAAAAGGGLVIYEQAGRLHLLEPEKGRTRPLALGVAADLIETRPRWVEGKEWVRSLDPSPSGARATVEMRGEIVTIPAEKGDPRTLTSTPGAHERSPVWSPDGKHIAYFSDAGGEYHLEIVAQDGRTKAKSYELGGAGFYEYPKWSPDSKKISYVDNSRTLFWIDVASGKVTRVDADIVYAPGREIPHSWSPDSQWLAYTTLGRTNFETVKLYSLATNSVHALTDGLADATSPVFDASGKYLWFLASTDAGPVAQWFMQSNNDMRATSALYLAVLSNKEASPLAPKSDEEKPADADKADADDKGDKADKGDKGDKGKDEAPAPVMIDLEGLSTRIVATSVAPANFTDLAAAGKGKVYFLERPTGGDGGPGNGGTLWSYDLDKREANKELEGVAGFALTPDAAKILYASRGDFYLTATSPKIESGKGKLATDKIAVRIDPRAEWSQIFHETWRINRDYFYDPGMHGADWPAMREKYAQFLPHLATRADLNKVIRGMLSELGVGHSYLGGGDRRDEVDEVPGGLLGADYEIAEGKYRFKKVFGGLNWNPDLRAPLTEPGANVVAGEYLLAVDGVPLDAGENLYARFERTAGRRIELEVGPSADGKGSRKISVTPIESEGSLRNRDWVEGNLAKVTAATDGRVAYVYVPNTAGLGHTYFKRYFFPQSDRQAIIVDERYNGGGQIADYYVDLLRRPLQSYWATRYGADTSTPLAAIHGPKVMIADETAGSGGDMLPWMFRQMGLGPIVGRPTWGGLVGILGFPVLMDGGFVTAPNIAIWTEDGFIVENVGVPPDIEVEQWPKDLIAGRDPQLEKAIEVVLEHLEADPPKTPERPPFPKRALGPGN
jgi:tricorn protease